jgi:uncharacterized protein YbjT (DUF2867 family)
MKFFETSARHLLPAEAAAGVGHHVALSIVGTDRMPNIGYMRAKVAQEAAIRASGVPYTVVRATQFFEFIGALAEGGADGNTVRLSPVLMQPVAADDVAAALADVAVAPPVNGIIELAGPEPFRLDELARRLLSAKHDTRQVTADVPGRYFGGAVSDHALTPGADPRIGPTRFDDWLSHSTM